MLVAVIDLGTNSLRFDTCEVSGDGVMRTLRRELEPVRLGDGLFEEGILAEDAIRRTLQALEALTEQAIQDGVEKVIAVATSVLREARNAEIFLSRVRERFGFEVHPISGEEEALLIAQGVLNRERGLPSRFAILDIGGGSTEIVVCANGSVLCSQSLPLGASRLEQQFFRGSTLGFQQEVIAGARRHIDEVLTERISGEAFADCAHLVGAGGTIRNLVRMLKAKDAEIAQATRGRITQLIHDMEGKKPDQLLRIPRMRPDRLDLMLPGTILLEQIMGFLNADTVQATNFSLREGLLLAVLNGSRSEWLSSFQGKDSARMVTNG